MKKHISILLALVLSLTFLVSAASADEFLSIATGGTGGTYYPLGSEIAAIFTSALEGVTVNAEVSGGSAENLRRIDSGDAELATVQNDTASYAFAGTDSFAATDTMDAEIINSFSVIAGLYPEVVQLVAGKDASVASIGDLAGKRVSVGAAGSGVYTNVLHVLEAKGLTLDDLSAQYLSFNESADAIKNRQIDAGFVTAGVPTAAITELFLSAGGSIVSLSDEETADLIAAHPFYTPYTIPKDTYDGMAEDAKTVAIMAILVCSNDLSEDLVYQMTKALFEGEISHAKGKEITLDTALDGVGDLPLHPGAEKYYREAGLIKD